MFIEGVEDRSIYARVPRQRYRVVNRGEHVGPMDDPEAGAELRKDLIFVPKRKRMMRDLAHLLSGHSRSSGAGYEGILIRVSSRNAPVRRDTPIYSNLQAIGALASSLDDPGWVVRIGRSRISTIQLIDGRC